MSSPNTGAELNPDSLGTDLQRSTDAEAIAEAASRPTMRVVSVESIEQEDIQALHFGGGANPHIDGGARLTRPVNNKAPLTDIARDGRPRSERITDVVEMGIVWRGTPFAQRVMQGEVIMHADPCTQILDEFDDG